jgi:predicted tellurium resistance membrane protein TerC
MYWLTDPQFWIGFVTLTVFTVVLGLDNVVFISIVAGKLKGRERDLARRNGLLLAMVPTLVFLLFVGRIVAMKSTLFTVMREEISIRDLILLVGGLFLVAKATKEIHHKLEGPDIEAPNQRGATYGAVLGQIMVLNVIFSLDTVITAVAMTDKVAVMVAAVVASSLVMLAASGRLGQFVDEHPSVKMLALAFLILIGANLVVEGLHAHIPKGYTYFTMAFSVTVEILNIRYRSRQPVKLHHTPHDAPAGE